YNPLLSIKPHKIHGIEINQHIETQIMETLSIDTHDKTSPISDLETETQWENLENFSNSYPVVMNELKTNSNKTLKLHQLSNLSVFEASLLIVSFSIRFSLSYEAKKALVSLIKLLLPQDNNI
ncbi:MAG: hypothetical protein ACK56I_25945, partial [bacterium]